MRSVTRWAVAVAAAVFVVSIGSPLLGLRVFHGTDLLLDRTPWRTTPPGTAQATNPNVQDTVSTFMPLHAEVRRRLAQGDLPLWTPLPGGGLPLGAVPDEGTFGPLNLPYRILPLWYAPGLAKLLELVAASGFTFLFLRRLGLAREPAVLGGLIYSMSGFQVVWTNWPQAHVGALIPAVFWIVERAIQERHVRAALLIAPAVAALVLEGFPSVAGYALVAAAIYAAVRLGASDLGWPARLRLGALLGLAALLGLGLTAFQLLPLAERAAQLDLSYRVQGPGSHLPPATALTLGVPGMFGSPVDGTYFGPLNYVEIQGFVGASTLILVASAAAWPGSTVRGSAPFLWGASVVCVVLLYVGGPLLAAVQASDLFRLNFVTRLRSVLGFLLASLAAVGLQALLHRRPGNGARPWLVWSAAALVGGAALLAVWRVGAQAGREAFVLRQAVLPAVAASVTAVCAWAARRRPVGRTVAGWAIPVVFAAEAMVFAVPFWPRVPRDVFYPRTRAHDVVQARLGPNRLVGAGGAMYPGTTTYYGLRSLTSNNTLPQLPAWEGLVRTVDPGAFQRSPVYPGIAPRHEVATSPVLDRLAVRYFFTPPTVRAFGRRVEVDGPGGDPVGLGGGRVISASVPGAPLRAVLVEVRAARGLGRGSRLTAEILRGDSLVARGYQLLYSDQVPGEVQIPVVQPCTSACPRRFVVRVRLEGPGEATLAGAAAGGFARSVIAAGDDGLRLDMVENVVGYRRTAALPRIRWAGEATVVEDPAERIRVLVEGPPPGEVLLSEPGPRGSGEPATIVVAEDSGDRIDVRVSTEGKGYLVVADPLQHGWVAEVDGSPVALRGADHGVVAVLVSPGRHRVVLRYDPPGWRTGLLISGISLTTLVSLVLWGRSRTRPRGSGPSGREMLPSG
jgi:hypothetical protein